MPYKLTCEIETSQVEIEEKLLDGEGTILPIVSNDESSSVPTMFRLDNFDTVVEQVEGEGSVNTNHMMAFQEMTPETKTNDNKVQIQSTKKKDSLWAVNLNQLMQISIQKKKKKSFISKIKWEGFKDNSSTYLKYFMWLLLRKMHGINEFNTSNDHVIPYFSGKIFFCLFLCHKYLVRASY